MSQSLASPQLQAAEAPCLEQPSGSDPVSLLASQINSASNWPFPSWSVFNPDHTLFDSIGQQNISFFSQEKSDHDDKRIALYSTSSPDRIYKLEDFAEFNAPPQAAGIPLSGDELWPRFEPSWLRYDGPFVDNYEPGPFWLKEIQDLNWGKTEMLDEIRALELMRCSPHPHLPTYLGCLVERDCPWVSGIVLKRYPKRLFDVASSDGLTATDGLRIISELESAIAHLHSLGVAHNDVSPYNVMLDEDLCTILIDFNGCLPFGEPLLSIRGTPGFSTDDWTTSDPAHDIYGLQALGRFLKVDQFNSVAE